MKLNEIIAMIVGVIAVTLYFLGYLQKKRQNIILFNVTSRILYILQYILLGAFSGAALDVAGAVSSILAERKNKISLIKKHTKLFVIIMDIIIVIVGLFLYKSIFDVLPIIGVLLHTTAFWIDDEKAIRRVSFLGSPFWLVYNFVSGAYPSCIGDILSMVSIAIAMVRYGDFKKKES